MARFDGADVGQVLQQQFFTCSVQYFVEHQALEMKTWAYAPASNMMQPENDLVVLHGHFSKHHL